VELLPKDQVDQATKDIIEAINALTTP